MKKSVIFAIIVTVFIPSLLFPFVNRIENNDHKHIEQPHETEDKSLPESNDERIINVLLGGHTEEMMMEEYILGVVLGEMPTNFDVQALMAQAVVARTFTCKSMNHSKHISADVCTDSSCCQAYISPEEYSRSGGSLPLLDKVKTAVNDTKGQVLTYRGELIEATYFSCSGGRTEPAYAVWGADVPYLQAVDSPGEEMAVHYMDSVTFTIQEFCQRTGIDSFEPTLRLVESISYTDGGGVESITINGKEFSGTQLRKLLDLRSTAFVISAVGDRVTVTTKGFGHRVGMSQYGAEAMAQKGSSYLEILSHYYPGTQLDTYDVDKNS